MFRSMQMRARALRLALALVGLWSAGWLVGAPGAGAAPPAQEKTERVGTIHVLALDNGGAGYAWSDLHRQGGGAQAPLLGGGRLAAPLPAATAAPPEPGSFLLRITPARWFVLADSTTAPTLLVPGLDVWRMVVSAAGQDGWAAGQVVHPDAPTTPALLRLHAGTWGSAADLLAPDFIPIDLTLSADGQAGWLTARNAAGQYQLWRWDGAQWSGTAQPAGGPLTYVAISPDGRHGWAVSADGGLFGLNGVIWGARPSLGPAPAGAVQRLTADDADNGWLLAGDAAASTLLRLTPAQPPQAAALGLAGPAVLTGLAVDASGQGWAVGTAGGAPVFVRLSGDQAAALPATSVGLPAGFTLPATAVTVSADGQSTWVGNAAGQMGPLAAAPPPGMPRTGGGGLALAVLALAGGLLLLGGLGVVLWSRARGLGQSR